MTVDVLKKFLVVKFAIPNTHQVNSLFFFFSLIAFVNQSRGVLAKEIDRFGELHPETIRVILAVSLLTKGRQGYPWIPENFQKKTTNF